MSETIRKSLSKFNTIALTDRNSRKNVFKTTQRKSNSVLMNPQSFNTTFQIQKNVSLPKITQKKRKKKYGTFLQSWLDEALGEADPYLNQQPKKNQQMQIGGVLKTLKRFELDKQYLQSLNIPGTRIQRLYQTLYIYSHGVEKTFKELLQFAKQYDNQDIIGNFWKAYSKLLESCTSYQTVFQKVEKDHIQNIVYLKHTIQEKANKFQQQKKVLNQKMSKLQKQLEVKENKFKILAEEYEVMNATLGLTDQAFNEEVNLRLKFEQKINAVYTSYQELKLKYEKIVQEMHIRKGQILQMENKQNELKGLILQEKVKVDELRHRLEQEKEKVKDRQVQIDIKRQELQDMKQIFQAKMNKDVEAGDIIEQNISKYKALNVKLVQAQNVINGLKISMKTKDQQIQKLLQNLSEAKNKNDKIYQANIGYGKDIVKLQSEILAKNLSIKHHENKIQQLELTNTKLNDELTEVTGIRDDFDKQNNILKKTVAANKITRDKNEKLIDDLKAVKDKYQRINEMLNENIEELTNMLNKKSNILNESLGQVESLKMLIESRNKSLAAAAKQIEQQRQITKVKMDALQNLITKKQSVVSETQKQIDEIKNKLSEMQIEHKNLQETIINKNSHIMKQQVSLAAKNKEIMDYQNQIKESGIRYQQLVKKMEENLQQKQTTAQKLSSTEFILQKRKQEQNLSIANLKKILAQYKIIIDIKAQYVHPMTYEQARSRAYEAGEQQLKHRKTYLIIKQKNQEITNQMEQLQKKYKQLLQKYQKLDEEHNLVLKKGDDLVRQVASQRSTIDNQKKNINELKNEIDLKNKRIKQLEKIEKELQQRNDNLTIQEQKNVSSLKQYQGQIKKLNSKINFYKKKQEEAKNNSSITQQVNAETQTQNEDDEINKNKAESEKILLETGVQTQKQLHLIQQKKEKQEQEDGLVPKYQSPLKEEDSTHLSTSSPPKKIEKRDFKKALKLTYMRR